jgi:Protein of unknown function (DUF551)
MGEEDLTESVEGTTVTHWMPLPDPPTPVERTRGDQFDYSSYIHESPTVSEPESGEQSK